MPRRGRQPGQPHHACRPDLLRLRGRGRVFVHRWTAEVPVKPALWPGRAAHRRFMPGQAVYRLWRAANTSHDLADGMGGTQLSTRAFGRSHIAGAGYRASTFPRRPARRGRRLCQRACQYTPPPPTHCAAGRTWKPRSLIALGYRPRLAPLPPTRGDFETRCQARPSAPTAREFLRLIQQARRPRESTRSGDDAQRYFLQSAQHPEPASRAEPQRADYSRETSPSHTSSSSDLMNTPRKRRQRSTPLPQSAQHRQNSLAQNPSAPTTRDLSVSQHATSSATS